MAREHGYGASDAVNRGFAIFDHESLVSTFPRVCPTNGSPLEPCSNGANARGRSRAMTLVDAVAESGRPLQNAAPGARRPAASDEAKLSMSFGVAVGSLATAVFIPDRFRSDPPQMIHGIHEAILVLGAITILSAVIFGSLEREDGDSVSRPVTALPSEAPAES